jgi:Fe-S cluster assembly protein SufB
MTDWRLEAFRAWEQMIEPEWANVSYTKPDFQAISYYIQHQKQSTLIKH